MSDMKPPRLGFLFSAVLVASLFVSPHATSGEVTPRTSSAPPYYRFWRGWKKPDVDTRSFLADLDSIFVPATVKNGAGRGLISYLPVLLPKENPTSLPEEIALVTYQ